MRLSDDASDIQYDGGMKRAENWLKNVLHNQNQNVCRSAMERKLMDICKVANFELGPAGAVCAAGARAHCCTN